MPLDGNVSYSLDVKRCARHIIKESFADILIGEFQVPSQDQMESYLFKNIDYGFDEYQVKKKIQRSNLKWSEDRINDELEKHKRRHEKEFRHNLKVAAQNAVNEAETLVGSLKNAIKTWKIKNLR